MVGFGSGKTRTMVKEITSEVDGINEPLQQAYSSVIKLGWKMEDGNYCTWTVRMTKDEGGSLLW